MGKYDATETNTRPTVAIVHGTVSRHVKGIDKNGRPWAGFTIDRGNRGRAIQCVAWRNPLAASIEVGQTVLAAGTFAVKTYKDKAGADRQAVQLEVALVQAEVKTIDDLLVFAKALPHKRDMLKEAKARRRKAA